MFSILKKNLDMILYLCVKFFSFVVIQSGFSVKVNQEGVKSLL